MYKSKMKHIKMKINKLTKTRRPRKIQDMNINSYSRSI